VQGRGLSGLRVRLLREQTARVLQTRRAPLYHVPLVGRCALLTLHHSRTAYTKAAGPPRSFPRLVSPSMPQNCTLEVHGVAASMR
jgi:hypothetical protein